MDLHFLGLYFRGLGLLDLGLRLGLINDKSPDDLTRVHDGVQPLGGEVAAVRGPHIAEDCATAEAEKEEKGCFLHSLSKANNPNGCTKVLSVLHAALSTFFHAC